jgi:hypothetical protein
VRAMRVGAFSSGAPRKRFVPCQRRYSRADNATRIRVKASTVAYYLT